MFSACEYQVLQTVSAWLDLRGNEVLYVEGAEDFDKLENSSAEAVQIKSSPASISLGLKSIQVILSQFWSLKSAASERSVRFRFLTRGGIAVEQSRPFGTDIAGLELWQRRSITDTEVKLIQDHLAKADHIAPSFQKWLKAATVEEVRHELIELVTWDTEALGSSEVERVILCKLTAFGEQRKPEPASLIKQVLETLKAEVWRSLRKQGSRFLDRHGLEEVWEKVTSVSVPRTALVAQMMEGDITRHSETVHSLSLFKKGIPPLPGIIVRRESLVQDWSLVLTTKGFVNLYGSSRTGKTTLAKLLALSVGADWNWWSGTGEEKQVQRALGKLVTEVASSPEICDVILDDLNFRSNDIEQSLTELAIMLKGRRGRLLVTSHKAIPLRKVHALGLSVDQILQVPRLEKSEVIELAGDFGCSELEQRKAWGAIIHAKTSGHPQLVAVRLIELRTKDWPACSSGDLIAESEAVEAEKADTRLSLTETLSSSQQELLLRISILPNFFRRAHGVELGACAPPLTNPGNLVDSLLGPWIEPLHGGYFSLSPLLADIAQQTLSKIELRALQQSAGHILLSCKPCDQIDFGNAFLLFWKAKDAGCLAYLSANDFSGDDGFAGAIAEQLWWFTMISNSSGQHLFEGNEIASLFLRGLQFKVACQVAPDKVTDILEAWKWELDNISEPDSLYQFMYSCTILFSQKVTVSAIQVIEGIKDIGIAEESYGDEIPFGILHSGEEVASEFDYLNAPVDPVSKLSHLCSIHCKDIEFLEELLRQLDQEEDAFRDKFLGGIFFNGAEAQVLIDRVWLKESEKEEPDWSACLRVFDFALKMARRWKSQLLASAVARGSTIVIDEYLLDSERAHKELDEMASPGDLEAHVVHDRRAGIFFSEKNYEAAEREWQVAFESWPAVRSPIDSYAAFAARNAAICSGHCGRWFEAANWFVVSFERLPPDSLEFTAAAKADAGYCCWKAGSKSQALQHLIEAWEIVGKNPRNQDDFRAFVTRKTIGHTVAWIHAEQTQEKQSRLEEPFLGFCSSRELPEKIRELPDTDSASVWLYLSELERELNGGTKAFQLSQEKIRKSTSSAVRSLAAVDRLARLLSAGDVDNIPNETIDLKKAFIEASKHAPKEFTLSQNNTPPEQFVASDSLTGRGLFVAAIIGASPKEKEPKNILTVWRRSLSSEASTFTEWYDWFYKMDEILSKSSQEAAKIAQAGGANFDETMLAAWTAIISESASPEQIYSGQIRLMAHKKDFYWLKSVEVAFGLMVESGWMRCVQKPALLRLPKTSVPEILKACAEGEPSFGKVARILRVASIAVATKVPHQIMADIRKLESDRS